MKRAHVLWLLLALAALTAYSVDYAVAERRAARFFECGEWASASAMYTLMLDERPEVSDTYSHAIVSAAKQADTAEQMRLLEQAMHHSIAFDSVMGGVRSVALSSGNIDTYEHFLLTARCSYPWLARAIDRFLLQYYTFRSNGPQMVYYSTLLLKGLPDNTDFLSTLASGYLLQDSVNRAMEVYEHILSVNPDDYDALLTLGNQAVLQLPDATGEQRQQLRTKAREWLQHAYSLRPTPYVASILKNI